MTETSATVRWTLDEHATGTLEYGATKAYGSFTTKETSLDSTTHVQVISGLEPGQTYHFRAISEDRAGNRAISADRTFATLTPAPEPPPAPAPKTEPAPEPPPADTTAPRFLEVTVAELSETSATIHWTLDEPANGVVRYDKTTSYGLKTKFGATCSRRMPTPSAASSRARRTSTRS